MDKDRHFFVFSYLATPMQSLMKNTFLKIAGYLSVALGFAGIFLPLLPTTPFLLLALWCFARSSTRMESWLLNNRLFGQYLKDYERGCGIPRFVKASTLIYLWSTILFSMIIFTEAWWIKILLLVIAFGVSIHVLSMKTKRYFGTRTLVLIPTELEAKPFIASQPEGVIVETVGVGSYRCAYNTYRLMLHYRPQRVILAGLAGVYPGRKIPVGESVLVKTERSADIGTFQKETFHAKFGEQTDCPFIADSTRFQQAVSNTVNAAALPYVDAEGADIENMEGIAFFHVCLQTGTPFWELRTISNQVGEPFEQWDLHAATQTLARDLNRLIHELEA